MSDTAQLKMVEHYFEQVGSKDWAAVSALRQDDFVQEWPQMGKPHEG